MAHGSVRPRESKSGAEERYTVRVPTEGTVATTHVRLEIPSDVVVLEVVPAEGATFETARAGERVTSITWKKESGGNDMGDSNARMVDLGQLWMRAPVLLTPP
jgi:uncharacterized protein YcnI